MPHKPFDSAAKELLWIDPVAWLKRLGVAVTGPVHVIDSDATSLVAAVDKVIKVDGTNPFLVVVELQSSRDPELLPATVFRQAAIERRHKLPVLSIIVLLRDDADMPALTGQFERLLPDGNFTSRYNYRVLRVWNEEPDSFLKAGLALLPLAPLAKIDKTQAKSLIRQIADQIHQAPDLDAQQLWTAIYVLMGLRYTQAEADELLKGVASMRESATYQGILNEGIEQGIRKGIQKGIQKGREKGLVAEARRLLVRWGTKQFGNPTPAVLAAIEAIEDRDRLESMLDQTIERQAASWNELLNASGA